MADYIALRTAREMAAKDTRAAVRRIVNLKQRRMAMMDVKQREALRSQIGDAVIAVQKDYGRMGPAVVVPEIIAALLSLAAYVSRRYTDMTEEHFMDICTTAAKVEWEQALRAPAPTTAQ